MSMRKLGAAAAGFLVSLFAPSSANAQVKVANVPTLSAPGMLVFGVVIGFAALLLQRRRR